MEVYRGDIFTVKNFVRVNGCEQTANRPAVVVSNNTGNKFSSMCEVVYLTTQEKKPLPTHVNVLAKVPSIAMCEQIITVSQERLVDYIRTCSEEEMQQIDRAMMISLGIDETPDPTATVDNAMLDALNAKVVELNNHNETLLFKLEGAERKLDELNAENAGLLLDNGDLKEKLKNAENQIPVFPADIEKELLKAETQRDMYKELYEQMLEKMVG